jgi:hypothetical protein
VSLERLDVNADGDLIYTFTRPWSDGTTGIKLSPLELLEKLAALVPLPRLHLVRYGGCLAPHSKLRAAIIPTPLQQGMEAPEGAAASPNWSWAQLLKRVFAIDMARCPVCQQGRLRIIAAITDRSVIMKILRHLKLAADPVQSKYSNSPSHWSYASTGAASACLLLHSHPYSASLWTAKAEGGADGLETPAGIYHGARRSGTAAAQRVPGDRKSSPAQPEHGS